MGKPLYVCRNITVLMQHGSEDLVESGEKLLASYEKVLVSLVEMEDTFKRLRLKGVVGNKAKTFEVMKLLRDQHTKLLEDMKVLGDLSVRGAAQVHLQIDAISPVKVGDVADFDMAEPEGLSRHEAEAGFLSMKIAEAMVERCADSFSAFCESESKK